MNEEIPYAIYVKNNEMTKTIDSSVLIELTKTEINESNINEPRESNELPISIEIVPHKAILIQDAVVVSRHNYTHNHTKCCCFLFCIPFMLSIIMVVGISNPEVLNL